MNFYLAKNKREKKITIDLLRKKNILANNFWLPMHKQPTKKNFLLSNYLNTNYIYDRIIVLPSSTFLSLNLIKKISQIIKKAKNIK